MTPTFMRKRNKRNDIFCSGIWALGSSDTKQSHCSVGVDISSLFLKSNEMLIGQLQHCMSDVFAGLNGEK